jgi:hypothetical protein
MFLMPENKWARLLAYVTGLVNQALRKKLTGLPVHAAFSKATNSVLVAAKRCAFSSR